MARYIKLVVANRYDIFHGLSSFDTAICLNRIVELHADLVIIQLPDNTK